jgi:hypothetical protein
MPEALRAQGDEELQRQTDLKIRMARLQSARLRHLGASSKSAAVAEAQPATVVERVRNKSTQLVPSSVDSGGKAKCGLLAGNEKHDFVRARAWMIVPNSRKVLDKKAFDVEEVVMIEPKGAMKGPVKVRVPRGSVFNNGGVVVPEERPQTVPRKRSREFLKNSEVAGQYCWWIGKGADGATTILKRAKGKPGVSSKKVPTMVTEVNGAEGPEGVSEVSDGGVESRDRAAKRVRREQSGRAETDGWAEALLEARRKTEEAIEGICSLEKELEEANKELMRLATCLRGWKG